MQRVVADAEPVGDAGAEALDEHVGVDRQAVDRLHPARVAQVQRERALVAVGDPAERRGVAHARVIGAHGVADARLLDLEHVGAEVGQERGRERSREEPREVEDLDAFQWTAHSWSPASAPALIAATKSDGLDASPSTTTSTSRSSSASLLPTGRQPIASATWSAATACCPPSGSS